MTGFYYIFLKFDLIEGLENLETGIFIFENF